MKTRLIQVYEEDEVFDLIAHDDEQWFLEDYQAWVELGNREDNQSNLAEFCRLVVVEFINENPWYNAGDNHINMTAAVFNTIQDYLEREAERDSSRAASQGIG